MYRYVAVLILSCALLGCGSGVEDNREDHDAKLMTKADRYENYWQSSVTIDVLANDDIEAFKGLEIVGEPSEGRLEIRDQSIIYHPPEKVVDVSFSYRVVTEGGKSAETDVHIKLKNGIKDITPDYDRLVEGITYPVTLELYVKSPATTINVSLKRDESLSESLTSLQTESDSNVYHWDYTPQGGSSSKSYLEASEDELTFSLGSETRGISYQYWDTPEPSELYNTIRSIWHNSRRSKEIVSDRTFLLDWTSFPAWNIPSNPNWNEDPFNNNTWLLYYHSLAWLHAYEYEYMQTGDPELRQEIKRVIFDYLAKSPHDNPANYMSWNDHSVAVRADVITYFYQQFMKQGMTAEERTWFTEKMLDHAAELRYLLDLDIYYAHNHSMFHAVSLLNISLTFPTDVTETDYVSAALGRIETLFSSMVVPESGFSREQATSYHFVAMELFMSASQFLQRIQRDDSGTTKKRLNLMVDAAAHLIYRSGGAPAMGDSNFNVQSFQRRLSNIVAAGDLSSDYFDHLTGASSGKPLQRVYLESTEGVVILRPNSGESEYPEQYVLVDFGLPKISHGHHDATHITYAIDGKELLVDAGGPYLYQGRERTFFDTKLSHNVPIVNDQIRIKNAATTLAAECNDSACWTLGRLDEESYVHVRFVLIPAGDNAAIGIFDLVEVKKDEASNTIELNWHFSPESSLSNCDISTPTLEQCQFDDARVGGFFVQMQKLEHTTRNVFYGFDDGVRQQGWVQPKFGTRVPAPVLSYATKGSMLRALTILSTEQESIELNELSNGYELKLLNHKVMIDSPLSDTPMISVSVR